MCACAAICPRKVESRLGTTVRYFGFRSVFIKKILQYSMYLVTPTFGASMRVQVFAYWVFAPSCHRAGVFVQLMKIQHFVKIWGTADVTAHALTTFERATREDTKVSTFDAVTSCQRQHFSSVFCSDSRTQASFNTLLTWRSRLMQRQKPAQGT